MAPPPCRPSGRAPLPELHPSRYRSHIPRTSRPLRLSAARPPPLSCPAPVSAASPDLNLPQSRPASRTPPPPPPRPVRDPLVRPPPLLSSAFSLAPRVEASVDPCARSWISASPLGSSTPQLPTPQLGVHPAACIFGIKQSRLVWRVPEGGGELADCSNSRRDTIVGSPEHRLLSVRPEQPLLSGARRKGSSEARTS
ncbi:unnamed protein product [Rangifer tarandus platyrhynchus]|uniref:Uncharacterized protein n=1 Tax=Rangifer tarandus platyrhynchus TaxID=3082113 RepID=A0AC59Z1D4_RANTA